MLQPLAIQSGSIIDPCVNLLPPQNQIIPRRNGGSVQYSKPKYVRVLSCGSSSLQWQRQTEEEEDKNEEKEKVGVVVKPTVRPRLVLKFMWMEKNIGIGIDQVIPGGRGTIPLSPYYFWPRKDAWEELRSMLQRKPWISTKQMVLLLNQATDIINLWQNTRLD